PPRDADASCQRAAGLHARPAGSDGRAPRDRRSTPHGTRPDGRDRQAAAGPERPPPAPLTPIARPTPSPRPVPSRAENTLEPWMLPVKIGLRLEGMREQQDVLIAEQLPRQVQRGR